MIEDLDFSLDGFDDIVARDPRYSAKAYALLMDVLGWLFRDGATADGEAILDEFRERTLDLYGPMSYTVLSEWGVKSTEDVGEMMFNLADAGRVRREDSDNAEAFVGGYDFKETFLEPYV